MNVVVIEETPGEYAALCEILRNTGYATQVVAVAKASSTIASEMPDVTILGCRKGVAHLGPLSKALCAMEESSYRGLIAIVAGDTAEARAVAREAGADAVVLSTASAPEVVDHVKSCARIVGLERKLRERVVELEGALRRLSFAAAVRGEGVAAASGAENRGGIRFLLTHTWTAVDDILRGMCTEYLQHPFEQVAGTFVVPPGCSAASISLTDVENELALELTFFTKPATARVVAAMFTGDASIVDDEVAKDVLLELANSGMGAVRAAFLSEEFRFAASTPKPTLARPIDKIVDGVEAKRMLTFKHGDALVHVIVAVRRQGRIKVRALLLREGMVIASDILNDAGLLLVRAGTRLTETSAGRIARMLPTLEVELADAA